MAKGLTTREKKFVAALLADPKQNATSAAIKAGYSKNGAGVTGHKLLKKANIAAQRDEKVNKLVSKYDTSATWVLEQLARVASYDPRKLFDADGRCKPVTELDDDTAMAISGMKTVSRVAGDDKDGMVVFTDFKLADRIRALELIGKHRAMFTDKSEVSGPDGGAIPVSLEIDL